MKNCFFIVLLFIFLPLFSISQNNINLVINNSPQEKIPLFKGQLIQENLFGPKKLNFVGKFDFEKLPGKKSRKDIEPRKLNVLYSGRIFSPGIIEDILFENKSSEELKILELQIYPKILEQPYSLYWDLTISIPPAKPFSGISNDAGEYLSNFSIQLNPL